MKEHLKKHKFKEQHKKKEFFVLADIELGFYRGNKTGHIQGISYCKKLCEARKYETKQEAMGALVELSLLHPCEALSLTVIHSSEDKALFLEKLLKEKQFNEV